MTKARDLANGGFGLVLVKPSSVVGGTDNGKGTVSFSAQTSVSLNDVFNATYDNYRIVCKISGGTDNDTILRWRLRVAGADDSNNTYYSASTYNAYNSTTFTNANSFPATSGLIPLISSNTADGAGGGTFDVMTPFASQKTTWGGFAFAKSVGISIVRGVFDTSTSFTGFTFFPSSNNISGKISVYGYNN